VHEQRALNVPLEHPLAAGVQDARDVGGRVHDLDAATARQAARLHDPQVVHDRRRTGAHPRGTQGEVLPVGHAQQPEEVDEVRVQLCQLERRAVQPREGVHGGDLTGIVRAVARVGWLSVGSVRWR
jgi:hypothetical protein